MKKNLNSKINRTTVNFILSSVFILILYIINNSSAHSVPPTNSKLTVYSNELGDSLTDLYKTTIDGAQKSIILIVYSLTDKTIVNALNRASLRGVDVKLICDAKATPYYIRSLLAPRIQKIERLGKGLMHQKILVTDQSTVLLGSSNMTTESLQLHSNLVLGINHPDIARCIHNKASKMPIEGRAGIVYHQSFYAADQPVELWFLPDNKEASIKIKNLIRSAQKTIRVAMFTWTRSDFTQEIIDAAKNGVDVQIVIDYHSGKGASQKIVQLLKDHGIPIKLSTGNGLLHHKFLVIDNTTLVNGSANWTKAAFKDNDDCFMIAHSLTQEQSDKLSSLWDVIWRKSKS